MKLTNISCFLHEVFNAILLYILLDLGAYTSQMLVVKLYKIRQKSALQNFTRNFTKKNHKTLKIYQARVKI